MASGDASAGTIEHMTSAKEQQRGVVDKGKCGKCGMAKVAGEAE